MSVNIVNKSTGALTKIAGNPVEQASGISYDHTSSGMAANNVQAAVDELKSGLTNYQAQNDINLEVPDRKNLLNYDAWKNVGVSRGSAIWENNGVTLTASENDCFTRFEPSYYPNDAKIYVKEGETITLSWEETTNKSGIVMIFPNGNIVGDAYVNNSDAKTVSYIVGSGITFVTFRFGVANSGETISYKNIQIEMGSTATTFAPYIPSVESRIEAVESGLTNVGKSTLLGSVQGTGDITDISSHVLSQYRFVYVRIGYYGTGLPAFGTAVIPVDRFGSNNDSSIKILYHDTDLNFATFYYDSTNSKFVITNSKSSTYFVVFGIS